MVPTTQRYNMKKIIRRSLWALSGIAILILLVAGVSKKSSSLCKEVKIAIKSSTNDFFVDEAEILQIIESKLGGPATSKQVGDINLAQLEKDLEKTIWIYNAELFIDSKLVLHISIEEREPIARVFTKIGESFYIDSNMVRMPLSDKFSALVPVFTNFTGSANSMRRFDSAVLFDVKKISMALAKDSFNIALMDQIDILENGTFEAIPKLGHQTILLGNAVDIEDKLKRLKLFYTQVMNKESWNKYSLLNLQFNGQVLAKRRDAADVSADSLSAVQLLQLIAENAERKANDTASKILAEIRINKADSASIEKSVEREDEQTVEANDDVVSPANAAVPKPMALMPPPIAKPKPVVKVTPVLVKPPEAAKKPAMPKPLAPKPKPKITQPKRNQK